MTSRRESRRRKKPDGPSEPACSGGFRAPAHSAAWCVALHGFGCISLITHHSSRFRFCASRGYISEDGRTVVARLPQSEAEIETFGLAPPPGIFAAAAGGRQ